MSISTGLVLDEKPSIGMEPTRLYDQSRYGNHGTYTNITNKQLPSGLWVRTFNGTSSLITIAEDPATLDMVSPPGRTVSVWWFMSADAAQAEYRVYMDSNSETQGTMLTTRGATNKVRISHNNGTGYFLVDSGNNVMYYGEWNFMVMAASTARMDGYYFSPTAGYNNSYDSGASATAANRTTLTCLGSNADSTRYFDGDIGLLKVWDRQLAVEEVYELYQSERGWFGV